MQNDGLSEPLRAQVEQMYKTYQSLIYGVVSGRIQGGREQAEDLTEEVFERACRSLKNGSGPVISTKRWLLKIAENVCLDYLKKRGMHRTLSLECPILINGEEKFLIDHLVDEGQSTEETVEQRELLGALGKALEKLPPHLQQAVILYYLSGLPSKDVSKNLDRSIGTVERYKREGIKQLQKGLSQE